MCSPLTERWKWHNDSQCSLHYAVAYLNYYRQSVLWLSRSSFLYHMPVKHETSTALQRVDTMCLFLLQNTCKTSCKTKYEGLLNPYVFLRPDRPWGPHSFLYDGYRVSLTGVKRPGRGLTIDHHLTPRLKKE